MALYLIRHGETVAGKAYIGRTDVKLSAAGWEAMAQSLAPYSPQQFAAIYSSPLLRCAEFASHWAPDVVQFNSALKEYDFGILDGLSGSDAYAQQREVLLAFWDDPVHSPPPQAEGLRQFEARVTQALTQVAHRHKGEDVLIFTHGGVIKLARAYQQGLPLASMFEIAAPHASLHQLSWAFE